MKHNRVRAGFSPALPTTPRMRVRTGRFLCIAKIDRAVAINPKAGYETLPPHMSSMNEIRTSHSLTEVQAFTLSYPLQ